MAALYAVRVSAGGCEMILDLTGRIGPLEVPTRWKLIGTASWLLLYLRVSAPHIDRQSDVLPSRFWAFGYDGRSKGAFDPTGETPITGQMPVTLSCMRAAKLGPV